MVFAALMKRRFFFFLSRSCRREKAGLVLLALFGGGILFCPAVAAQSREELQTLQLFYKDNDLVVSATRNPKPLSQVAENITVVTAGEIEAMNAHSVAEVLNRVPGMFVDFTQEFGAVSQLGSQGSEPRHVLVLVDGMPWNLLSEGSAETRSIPVGIIERIEIIKGPASSAWGSSLGGVVNILTKEAGAGARPTGSVKVSYGERSTQDYSAQVAGGTGPVGYYLFAGRQDSGGLRYDRRFDATSLFSKFRLTLAPDVEMGLSMGFGKPRNQQGLIPELNLSPVADDRVYFLNGTLAAALTPELDLNFFLYTVEQKVSINTGAIAPSEPFLENIADEGTTGATGRLAWSGGRHTAVLGVDLSRGTLDQTINSGSLLQSFGASAVAVARPAINKWALYANDTITLGKWTVTPGLRYDYNDIIGSFVSPSLGVTRRLGEAAVARASLARGFTVPPLSWTSAGGLFLPPNPSLKPESIWSYQAGLETTLASCLWLKGTVFYHDLDDALMRLPVFNASFINQGAVRRRGLELEGETIPFYNVSLMAGLAYVHIYSSETDSSQDIYTGNIGLKYDDRRIWQARLSGHYVWWDLAAAQQADYGDWLWDLNLARKVYDAGERSVKLFLAAHNIFNGSQYTIGLGENKNPERWLEAGIEITF